MIEWIVSSSVLIVVVILLRFVLKGKISLRLQYALWALVLGRLLVPFSLGGTVMSIENLTRKAASSEPAQIISALSETELPRMSYQDAYTEVAKEYADRGVRIEDMPREEYAETVDYEIMNKMNGGLSVAGAARIIWISGIVLVGIWFLLSNLRLYLSLKKTRVLLTDSCALPVYLSDAVDTPCLFGLFCPTIYLTGEAIGSEHTQRHAVEHELTHYRHKDNIWAILRSVCLAVHWFNPLVWCAAVLSRNDAELACDESTILRLGEEERTSYGRTLIRLTCEKHPSFSNTATTMTGRGKAIKERITLIVKKPKMALCTLIAVAVIVAAAVGCTFTGAKEADTPWNWAQSLTAADITAASLHGSGVPLTAEETAELVRLLNTLEEKSFQENAQSSGSDQTYGVTLQTHDGQYNINGSAAPAGSLEMSYGDKQWWIDAKALSDFIAQIVDNKESSSGVDISELLDDAYERALPYLNGIPDRTAANTISQDTAREDAGETRYGIEFPVKGMDRFVRVIYTRESISDKWVFSSGKALMSSNPAQKKDIQEIIDRIFVGTLSFDPSWQSAGAYTITISGADGRTDTYSRQPENCYSYETPGYQVKEMYVWVAVEPWADDFSNSDYILTAANDRYSVTFYSQERKMKTVDAEGTTMYYIGTSEEGDLTAYIGERGVYMGPFNYFRRYAIFSRDAYELYTCSVDGSETDYEGIAQALSEQFVQVLLDRPGWCDNRTQDAKVSGTDVYDAYYGEDMPNFCFGIGLRLKLSEEQVFFWEAGSGLAAPPSSGEFAGYYGCGYEVGVCKGEDGRWRMGGFNSGGCRVRLPVPPEEATAQQLAEVFFLTSGFHRDWRIPYALAEKPLAEVREALELLDPERREELTAAILNFVEKHPDYCAWTASDFKEAARPTGT